MVTLGNNSKRWTMERLYKELAELESLLERADQQGDDIDAQWARELFKELIERRKEMLNTIAVG